MQMVANDYTGGFHYEIQKGWIDIGAIECN